MRIPLRRIAVVTAIAATLATGLVAAPAQAADTVSITGRIASSDGSRLYSQRVCAYPIDHAYTGAGTPVWCSTFSTATGDFHIDGIDPTARVRVASLPEGLSVPIWFYGDSSVELSGDVFDATVGDIGVLTVPAVGGVLKVTITDGQKGGTFRLIKTNGEAMRSVHVTPSTINPVLSFTGLAAGQYLVEGSEQGVRSASRMSSPVTVAVGRTTSVSWARSRGGTVTGRITDAAGNPLPGLVIKASNLATKAHYGTTDADGRYSIGALSTGRYSVVVNTSNYIVSARVHAQGSQQVAVSVGHPTDLSLSLASTGYVALAPSGMTRPDYAHAALLTSSGTTVATLSSTNSLVSHVAPGRYLLVDVSERDSVRTTGRRYVDVVAGQKLLAPLATARDAGTPVTIDAPVGATSVSVCAGSAITGTCVGSTVTVDPVEHTASIAGLPSQYYTVRANQYDVTFPSHRVLVKGAGTHIDLSGDTATPVYTDVDTQFTYSGHDVSAVVKSPTEEFLVRLNGEIVQVDWRNAVSSAPVYVRSSALPTSLPYYWTVAPSRLLRSDPTLTITGIGGR